VSKNCACSCSMTGTGGCQLCRPKYCIYVVLCHAAFRLEPRLQKATLTSTPRTDDLGTTSSTTHTLKALSNPSSSTASASPTVSKQKENMIRKQVVWGKEFKGVPFASWLYRIAKSEVYTAFRKEQAKRTVNMDTAGLGDIVEDMEEDKYGPYIEVLKESVTELEEEDMQFVEMRFFEKRAFKEIAEIFGITENNAKVKTYRILEKLKKIVLAKAREKKQEGVTKKTNE